MSTIELVFKIAGTGAIGVACLALYFWRTAFGQLLQYAAGKDQASERLDVLAGQLSNYQKLVIGALAASVAVQLVAPIIDRAILPPQTKHPVTIAMLPGIDDTYVSKHAPTVSQNGTRIAAAKEGGWRSVVERESMFLIDILPMRDRVRTLEALNESLVKAASTPVKPGESERPTPLGF